MLTRLQRLILFGWQGFIRNGWLSFIAVLTLALSIMAISVLGVLNQANKQIQQNLENKLDLAVFFRDVAPEERVMDFVQQVGKRSDVREVSYFSKEEAQAQFLQENQSDEALISAVNELDNPFPRFVRVKADSPDTLSKLNDFANQVAYEEVVESTSYQQTQNIIASFVNTAKFTRLNSIVITIFFILYSVLVVFNMIRLAIFARREEVEIMRVVGATNVLIRMPFVVEGIMFGILGAAISLILLALASQWESGQIREYFGVTNPLSLPSSLYRQYFSALFWTNMGAGILLAASASYLAVRRYLHV